MTTIGLSYSLVKISTKCAPALDLVGGAGQEYRCGDNYYRPYRQNGHDLYIQGDPPGLSPQRPIKKAP